MGVVERPLASWSCVPAGCARCVFTECGGVPPGELGALRVDGSPTAKVPVAFRGADGEVRFPSITVGPRGSLRAVVRNRWDDSSGGGGYYSLLPHAGELEVENNPQALRDLLAYAMGVYRPGRRWRLQQLPGDMAVMVQCAGEDLQVVERLRRYFDTVEAQVVSTALQGDNMVGADRVSLAFTGCGAVEPQTLAVDADVASGEVEFHGADGEVRVPHIAIGPRGNLRVIVHNRWSNGREDGRYSLLWHAETLEVRDNPAALRDLADYAEGRYRPGRFWQVRELPASLRVRVLGSRGALPSIMRLSAYFDGVTVDGVPAAEYLAVCEGALQKRTGLRVGPLERSVEAGDTVILGGDAPVYHVTWCDQEIKRLVVRQQLEADQVVVFHGPGPVTVGEIRIEASGNLRSALQGYWFDGEGGGFFSPLHRAGRLEIKDNPVVLHNLLAYAEGTYPLDDRWELQPLGGLSVEADCSAGSLLVVEQLKGHFKTVVVWGLNLALHINNTVSGEYVRVIFTDSRAVGPRSLTVDASIKCDGINFRDADGEVYIPSITIGPRGGLGAVVRNYWWDGKNGVEQRVGYYSLLHHAQKLEIQNNPKVAKDLVAYLRGIYPLGRHWKLQEPDRHMEVIVTRTDESVPLIRQLVEYFRYLVVVSDLSAENTVNVGCYQYILTNCRGVTPQSLTVDARFDAPAWQLKFDGADGEVHIPEITIGPQGNLAAIVRNRWQGNDNSGPARYSLLPYAEELAIRDNPGALRDLLSYVEGQYRPGENWQLQKLPRGMRVTVWCAEADMPVVGQLRGYFDTVEVRGIIMALQTDNIISADHVCLAFTDCGAVEPQSLVVDANVEDGEIEFRNANGEVHIPNIVIGPHSNFRAVVCNRWWSGQNDTENEGGNYSLLHHVQKLEIQGNPKVVRDLVAYIEGTYQLSEHWQWQGLRKDMQVVIKQIRTEPQLMRALRAYFTRVVLRNVQMGSTIQSSMTGEDNSVWGDKQNIFTGCRDVPLGELQTLSIDGSPATDVPVEFRDAAGEVYFPEIRIGYGGSLRAVLQNRWEGEAHGHYRSMRSGFYSLLPHAKRLQINSNPQAVRCLVAYAQGTYPLGKRWKRKKLPRDMEIVIKWTKVEPYLLQTLRKHFMTVLVPGSARDEVMAQDILRMPLRRCGKVYDGRYHVFTGCRDAPLEKLEVLRVYGSPAADVPVAFQDADGEVCFPKIYIDEGGGLRAVLHNRWEDGAGGGGYYSLLHHAGELGIWKNPRALRDLAFYVEGTYQLGEHWRPQQLDRNMKVTVQCTEADLPIVERCRQHLGTVEVRVLSVALHADNMISADRACFVFTGCRGVEPRSLVVDAEAQYNGIEFQDTDDEVHFPEIYIKKSGNLRAVLQNRWENGRGGGGYYSLLPHARELVIKRNPQALRDLLAYAEGVYELGNHWRQHELDRRMRLSVDCAEEDLRTVERLRLHLAIVTVKDFTLAMQADCVLDVDCEQCILTGCRDVAPRSMIINARTETLSFYDADAEVRIPELAIGPQGDLGTAVYSSWWNGRLDGGEMLNSYSLLQYTKALTIRCNPYAVRDLVAHVKGQCYTDKSEPWARPPDGSMRITVKGVQCCEKYLKTLIEYFGAIVVDGRRVLSRRRRLPLEECNGRERSLRALHTKVRDKREVLDGIVPLLTEVMQRAQQARQHLQKLQGRLEHLITFTQQ